MSDSLRPHELQHARLLCPSPSPRICSNSCPLSWWCHLTISSSVTCFSFFPQSFPASGSFPMSQIFASGDQSIGASALASVLPMNIHSWFLLGLTSLISLLSKGLSRVFFRTTVQKHQFFSILPSLWSSSHICTRLLEKTIALTMWTCVGKVMSLLFNMLSRFVIAFLPRSKRLLISQLYLLSTVILGPRKIKSVSAFTFPPSICHEMIGPDAMILVFSDVELQASFFTFLFHPHQEAYSFLFTFCH